MFVVTLYIATERVELADHRSAAVLRRRVRAPTSSAPRSAARSPTSTTAPRSGSTRSPTAVRRGLPARAVAARARHRRPVRRRARAAGSPTMIPEVHNDFIFAGIGEEIGLFGLSALLVRLPADRRARPARRRSACATRSASCSPVAWRSRSALQVFVIVGGISQADPADRPDHAVPVRRWLVADGQLDADRAAAADLRRGTPPGRRFGVGAAARRAAARPAQLHGAPTEVIKP